jgi:ribosome-binding protein aMBF1 (putative translation factor)
MKEIRSVAEWMAERGLDEAALVAAARLEARVVSAIVHGQYTPSPQQRQALAAALGVPVEQVAWGHEVPVDHMYGHGPQFGRSP